MDKRVVTFGEIMMRLEPPGFQRFVQARSFGVTYAGGEANVAASLATFGIPVEFVTRLPANEIGDACINYLRQFGIGVTHVIRGGERLGIYFLEMGSAQRSSKVIYDRAGSAIAQIEPGMVDWKAVFADADWFHWTGITPAISKSAADVCLDAVRMAKEMGLTVSCDLNYRGNLWKWGKSAGMVMPDLVAMCDVAVGNEEDADKVFGIKALGSDTIHGKVDAQAYTFVCQELAERFKNLKVIAITLRVSHSASHNNWSAIVWQQGEICTSPKYDILPIVDRVGGGDSFCAGLIYGLNEFQGDIQRTVNFAVAGSCLKHTIPGDFNLVSIAEVQKLMDGDTSGRVSR